MTRPSFNAILISLLMLSVSTIQGSQLNLEFLAPSLNLTDRKGVPFEIIPIGRDQYKTYARKAENLAREIGVMDRIKGLDPSRGKNLLGLISYQLEEELKGSSEVEQVWVATRPDLDSFDPESLVGFMILFHLPYADVELANQGIVGNLVVVPPHAQRRGIGIGLLRTAYQYLREKRIRYCQSMIHTLNVPSFRLHHKVATEVGGKMFYVMTFNGLDRLIVDLFPKESSTDIFLPLLSPETDVALLELDFLRNGQSVEWAL